ncbi:DUF2157 domain-containing protein [Flavobacterium sp. L1I52]|uniref:DUF2157 domain-containing protein n=1 Tax=Flavobacterium pokkalii TaxID=1940408 RepID=A0ABR7UUD1_9FLAO|nr:DUF2157 domain-containing protein [Flavobacterium pokkalii]MBD0726512.1 DUF2157 domain-containing protein [Flavobacterium pokkalii]
MKKLHQKRTQTLVEQDFISQEQASEINNYRNRDFFSLYNELKILLYLSVVMFSSGMGILIYQNIDTIGHTAILSLLLILILVSFYFCFKNFDGFKKTETTFSNPVFDYLVLAANLLSCIFIGYLQLQYNTFGTHYGLATLVPTLVSFFCAYYFDNKSSLSIAISGLTAYIGLSINPTAILDNQIYENPDLTYSALGLGILLILWTIYSEKSKLKEHFSFIILTFALHLISIACIANLFETYWFVFELILGLSIIYFYFKSIESKALSLFFFLHIYAYIGFNVLLFKIIDLLSSFINFEFYILLGPVYFVGSILLFTKQIKNFNKKNNK